MGAPELEVALARVEGKIDNIVTRLDALKYAGLDHEDRVRALEKHGWKAQGWAACVAFIISVATVVIATHTT